MTLSIPPEYVNVIASTVYDADLPASLFQAYCRIVGLAWRDRHHQPGPVLECPRRGWCHRAPPRLARHQLQRYSRPRRNWFHRCWW